jgi:hypothetical protein
MKKVVLFVSAMVLVACSKEVKKDYVTFSGQITNKNSDSIVLSAKDYYIKGIPRFILIDPDGNIISPNAPGPSDPELRTLLEEMI